MSTKTIPVSQLGDSADNAPALTYMGSARNGGLSRRARVFIEHPSKKNHFLFMFNWMKQDNGQKILKIVLPGGGVEDNENVYKTLNREVIEELGIDYNFTPNNTLYLSRQIVKGFYNKEITDSSSVNDDEARNSFTQLIFFELKDQNFYHIPRIMERDKTMFVTWETLENIFKKVANIDVSDVEYGVIPQTGLMEAINDLYKSRTGTDIYHDFHEIYSDSRQNSRDRYRSEDGSRYAKEYNESDLTSSKVSALSPMPSKNSNS